MSVLKSSFAGPFYILNLTVKPHDFLLSLFIIDETLDIFPGVGITYTK